MPLDLTSPPAERAGLRLLLGLLGALAVVAAAVPLALLVRTEQSFVLDLDLRTTAAAEDAVAGSDGLLLAAQATTLLGDPLLMTVLSAVLALVLWRTGRTRLALFVLAARAGAMVLSTGLKLVVDRARPVFEDPVALALGGSFPSGHALGSASFWTMLALVAVHRWHRLRLLLGAALAIAVAVAASRVLLGVHYLSDVVGGFLIGVGWTALCAAVFTAWWVEEPHPEEPHPEQPQPQERT